MSLPDKTPKLPIWIFLITDAALIAAAWFIADQSAKPLPLQTSFLIVACVAAGAAIGLVPLVARYERKKNEALDERQHALEALSRTVATSAEQISIAASGLHQITEIAHKNLKQAEQLPHKLQEKIAEFQAQLDNAREDDREELEKELAELRASESERLAALADKIRQAVAELAKLDASAQKHITARTEIIERAQGAAARVQTDATVAMTDALAAVTREINAAQTKALAAIDTALAERTASMIAAIEAAAAKASTTLAAAIPASPSTSAPVPAEAEATPSPTGTELATPPKRPRKSRREDSPPGEAAPASIAVAPESEKSPELSADLPPSDVPAPQAPAAASAPEEPRVPPAAEPPPVPVETIQKIEPVAPASADPFPPPSSTDPSSPTPPPAPAASAPANAERPAKKRAPKKSEPDTDADLGLQLDIEEPPRSSSSDDAPVTAGEAVESVMSSDGATRLIATAYIGIGNRLFIRGDGPGLSWEKGVPLQFVSIGKWRWETPDAAAPIRFKLYKNDEIECAALGELTLEPSHQQEVTARF